MEQVVQALTNVGKGKGMTQKKVRHILKQPTNSFTAFEPLFWAVLAIHYSAVRT